MQEHPTLLINGGIQSAVKRETWTIKKKKGLLCLKTTKKVEWIKSRGDLLIVIYHACIIEWVVRGDQGED